MMLVTGDWNVNIGNHVEKIVVWTVWPGKQKWGRRIICELLPIQWLLFFWSLLTQSPNNQSTIYMHGHQQIKSTQKSNWLYHCHKGVEEVTCNNKIVAGGWLWNRLWIAYVQVPRQAKAEDQSQSMSKTSGTRFQHLRGE